MQSLFWRVKYRIQDTGGEHVFNFSFFFYCCSYHFGALTNLGELLTWGANSSGALGHGSEDQYDEPEPKLVESMKDMFTFAIGFGGWQSSVLAIPTYNDHA